MKPYFSELFMALAGVCLLWVVSPYSSSMINLDYSLFENLTTDFKEVPKFFIFSAFTPALILVMIFGTIIARKLGLISRRKYAQYCYAVSAFTVITVLIGFFRFGTLFWTIISLLPMLIGSYFARTQSGKNKSGT